MQQSSSFKFPRKETLSRALHALDKKEWYIFVLFFIVFTVSAFAILWRLNNQFLVDVPARGGSLTEGIVGTPRFVNPVLAVSDADKDITALVYNGLVRENGDGSISPDLAEEYTISDNGLVYTFTLREDAVFHDGTPVTADDVVFTINLTKEPNLKSPKRLNWEGVSVSKIDERTIELTLKQPYSAFLENCTLGILPSHLWKDLQIDEMSFSDLNTNAIGSGPYKINKIAKKSSGVPDYYELRDFKKFTGGDPYISKYTFRFYANERDLADALRGGQVEQASGLSPAYAATLETEGLHVANTTLPRIFGLFLNQNQAPLFTDKNVRIALDMAIDKNTIVQNALYGFGSTIDSPIPLNTLNREAKNTYNIDQARALLDKSGWKAGADGILEKKDPKGKSTGRLEFSIATTDSPELQQIAKLIKTSVEAIGGKVDVRVYDMGTLNQTIIRPRKYDALLFGEIVNHESDLFAFWHSSQRNDPGLNIALYTNSKVDGLLESLMGEEDPDIRKEMYDKLDSLMGEDSPALFLYSPDFIYVLKKGIHNIDLSNIAIASDRFANVSTWYTSTDRVWKIFIKN